jgi:type VI secretion system protein ImpG
VVREDGRTAIRIAFDLLHFEQRTLDDLSRIRLYLHGDRATASALYAALTRQVDTIAVRMPSIDDGRLAPQPRMKIEAAGFGPETRLWPCDDAQRNRQLDPEQTMLEYFTFPEKFHFVDLCGFDSASVPVGEMRIEFEIVLNGRLAGDATFGRDNIRLFCTPVINLFEIDAAPLQPNGHDRDYPVRAPDAAGAYVEPYEAVSVTATDLQSAERHAYRSFNEFKHRGGMLRHESPQRYFHTSMRFGVTGGREMWLTLGGQLWDEPGSLPDAHVTVRVLANNGTLPRMALREATITEPASDFTGIRGVRNLTQPTVPCYPPRNKHYAWQVMSHFSGRELDMMDTEVLRGVLALYDWTRLPENEQRIAAIERLWIEQKGVIRHGGLLRIIYVHVAIDATAFVGPGDVTLFGDVLSRFVGRYACHHYSVRLVLLVDGKETVYPRTDFTGSVL